jgi:hypothetical protein
MLEAEVVGEGDGKAAEDLTFPHLQRPLLSIIYKFIEDTVFYRQLNTQRPGSLFCF